MQISSQQLHPNPPRLGGMSGSGLLVVVERLEPSRIALRAIGVMLAVTCGLMLVYMLIGLLRATLGAPLPGWNTGWLGWAARTPWLATPIVLMVTSGVSLAAVLLTWSPGRRVFSFDRANAYMRSAGKTTRYNLGEISVSAYPHRLHLRGENFPIESHDYERLAGFLRVVSHERPRFRPVAAVKQTIIENARPLRHIFQFRRVPELSVRHPTQSA
jgi:hypothetical protein